jgi:hypothetical protein
MSGDSFDYQWTKARDAAKTSYNASTAPTPKSLAQNVESVKSGPKCQWGWETLIKMKKKLKYLGDEKRQGKSGS